MTFKEWLEYAVKHRHTRTEVISLLPQLELKDGTDLSVQASDKHCCEPEETLETADYESVEVLAPDELEELKYYQDSYDKLLYKRVPVELMEKVVTEHGGIIEPCQNTSKQDK